MLAAAAAAVAEAEGIDLEEDHGLVGSRHRTHEGAVRPWDLYYYNYLVAAVYVLVDWHDAFEQGVSRA